MSPVQSSKLRLFVSIAFATSAFLNTRPAQALPLLAENAAGQYVSDRAVAIYPDSSDPNKFYYFPDSSALSLGSDGTPEFSLAYTGVDAGDATAEGLMTATFHLRSEPSQIKAIQAFLASHPGAQIGVLPVAASTLSAGDPNKPMSFFKSIDLPAHGGLPDSDVGFSAEVNAIGVKLIKGQIQGSTAKGLQACYKFQGLGPNMDATVHIAWSQVYDYFKASASGGYLWFRADVTRVVETLRTNGVIRFTINGGDAKEQDYIYKIVDQMIEKFFKADLTASPDSAGNSVFDSTPLHLGINSVHKEDSKDFDGSWIIRDLVERDICVDMSLHDVAPYVQTKVIDADK